MLLWLLASPLYAEPASFVPLQQRLSVVLNALDDAVATPPSLHPALPFGLRVQHCQDYPYNEGGDTGAGARQLVSDLRQGLAKGLQCLIGSSPAGRLHPYHEYQAHRLLSLIENEQAKTFLCVADQMFATAVATSPTGTELDDPLVRQLVQVEHPAVLIDTFRLGGLLSRRHDDETYRQFFHLEDQQILEHRTGQPLRPANLHRYGDRAGLLFHEITHWLGHQHSALYPDLTHLYETCCFGGSDYISDPERNRQHQQTACRILQDDELWSQAYTPYHQFRLWHYKGYDQLKPAMRADYDD